MSAIGGEVGKRLCKALGLPPTTYKFTMHAQAGDIIRIECEFWASFDNDELIRALAQYELSQKSEPTPLDTALDGLAVHKID